MKFCLIYLFISLINYIIITTVVDGILMGVPHLRFSLKSNKNKFIIDKTNSIDLQHGNKCSAFAAAYVLRHFDTQENGNSLYEIIPDKMKDGTVYPKGILKLLPRYGCKVRYCIGNITALKNEVCKGNPVIVLIRTQRDKNLLHFVPVVGYDEQYIFIAESLEKLVNCKEQYYNRKIAVEEFKKLWNTSMVKMPLYRNTYITAYKKQ